MGRFTFASGNLRKIAALPLYGLGALASAVTPRRPGLWAFGSGTGVGEGALPLLQEVRRADPRARVVWLARDEHDVADARRLGIPAAQKHSWRGFRLTLRAQVVVVTHGFGDVNRFAVRGAFVVNLWHGIPFKRIRIDSPEAMRVPLVGRVPGVRALVKRAYARAGRGIALFPTASEAAAARIRTAFALTKRQAVITGDPRDDVLLRGAAEDRERAAREQIALRLNDPRALTERIVMYAPTWRDGQRHPAVPSVEEWLALDALLERAGALLLVRAHPLGRGDFAAGAAASDRIALLGSDLLPDVTPVLPAVDTLITDYSSIAFDFALVGGPILFLAPDVADYAGRRGVYEPYDGFSGGREVSSWAALVPRLDAVLTDAEARAPLVAHSAWLASRFHAFRDGRNTQRVHELIRRRLAGEADAMPPAPPAQPDALTVDGLAVEHDDGFVFTAVGPGPAPAGAALSGARAVLPGSVDEAGGRWRARIPLVVPGWSGPGLPPRSGDYALRLTGADGHPLALDVIAAALPDRRYGDAFRLAAHAERGVVQVTLAAPLSDDEVGAANQRRLLGEYRAEFAPLEDAVFFESYFGRNVSCNPLGIDRALAELHPEVTRYWSVADASVEVPPGAVRVIEGSEEWWHARAASRLLVVNDWLRKRWHPRPGQHVLQTWHGTPLKRLALDKPGFRPRARLAVLRESRRWDLMLAQNPFSADVFRSAYAFRGPIWQEGYPRNDVVVTGDRDAVRARLGIAPEQTAVLYAPTWRDDRPGVVDHLDVAQFQRELGDGYVTLIRGHSRTLGPGAAVVGEGVIDLTSYPDISELYLAADMLVTDYSSVMFDFTVTAKPIFFHMPDLERYRDQTRGFNFDPFPVVPGPITTTMPELVAAVRGAAAGASDHAQRYDEWRRRFNPKDDGQAGRRVVERLYAEGYL
ncbi:CDP-glycerol glycerophosphotransferase family protein [Gryllotalpicola ginsengisoli]|uniref:CDP-glycerol glycerophosphotransferase family protein n=1 Tax=Gryllotalpicola ginsengisoli TaxID=444608 RepID=UPI0003B49B65|nr:CDP-glycerol glycerophosphotransferase family protein [Gryllotalpicola ginsengisoli]